MKRHLFILAGLLAFVLVSAKPHLYAQGGNPNAPVKVKKVQGNEYMLTGSGGNVTIQLGNDGVLLVDTQFANTAPKILEAVRKLTDKPIRYIINTHVHGDHAGGNELLAKADGAKII